MAFLKNILGRKTQEFRLTILRALYDEGPFFKKLFVQHFTNEFLSN